MHSLILARHNRVVDQYKVLKKIYVGFGKRKKYWPKVMERYKKFDDFNSKFHIHKYYGDLDEMKECLTDSLCFLLFPRK